MQYLKTFEKFTSVNKKEAIMKKLEKSIKAGYFGENVEESVEAVKCDFISMKDFDDVLGEDKEGKKILKKMSKNEVELWNTNLKDTFDGYIIETVKDGNSTVKYNGWYEDLLAYLKK
jgi:hypothetical protein